MYSAIVLLVLAVLPSRSGRSPMAIQNAQKEIAHMTASNSLEHLLAAANWDAVDEAQHEGPRALPAIRVYVRSNNYRSRQIALASAARVGGDEAASMLATGLTDDNVNVQLQAAKDLSTGQFPSASGAILAQLANNRDHVVKQFLALAAGYIPGEASIAALRPLAEGKDELATNARMALARLGDENARRQLTNDLSATLPRTRYDALDQLRYVNDLKFASYAKRLLDDKEPARRIGTARHPKFRRVCDQAVDTLVSLLSLKPPFRVAPERIYTEGELTQLRRLLN